MFRQHFHRLALGLCLAGLAAAPVAARDLTIGLASSVTAIDPHYHFTGANMSMSRHFFDPLILKDEKRRLRPGLAVSWRAVDDHDLGVQAARGREVPRRLRLHRRGRRVLARARAANVPNSPGRSPSIPSRYREDRRRHAYDPAQDGEPYPQMPSDIGTVMIVSQPRRRPRTTEISTAARRRSAPGRTGSCAGPRATASSSRATTRYWGEGRPWDQVTFR